jgi:outer membrane protein OmpA-like peptidoglycan-associated protein
LTALVLNAALPLTRFGVALNHEPHRQMAATLSRPTLRRLRRGFGVAMLAGLLAGCSMFGGSDSGSAPAPSTGQTATSSSDAGAAAAKPATTSTPAAQQPVASGLVADQQNTSYSDQPLTALSEQANAPPPQQVTTLTPPTTSTTEQPVEVPGAAAPAESSATTASVQAPAEQPPAVQASTVQPPPAQPQLATAPQPTTGITPLAPPPNPLPPATQTASTMPESTASVTVDQSQLGGAVPQEQLYPTPYAPSYGAPPSSSIATGSTYVAQPASLPPPGAPIAVVFFADASSSLSDRAMGVLRNVILVQRQVGGQLRIIGHASERTAAVSYSEHISINHRLSQARANAVARALIGFGAAPGSISVAAVGSQQPVYLEVMPTGEAGNRRVEVYLDGASASVAAASPALVQPATPAQPVTVANGSVTVDLSALDQPTVASGYYTGGQAPSYAQSGSPQLADAGYAPPAVLSSGGLLYPPTQSPVSMLTVPPPPGAEPYVAEQAPATATGAATPPSNATAETSTPAVPADSSGTASSAAASTSEQTPSADSTGGATDSTQTGSAPATTASGTDTSASAGTGAATGTDTQQATADAGAATTTPSAGTGTAAGADTQQAATGTAADTGGTAASGASAGTGAATGTSTQQATTGATTGTGSVAATSGGAMTTASAGGTEAAAAPTLVDGQLRIAFTKDSAEIPDAAKSELDSLAQKMTADGTMRIELTAYASGTPDTATQARRLSLLRALAVRSYLIRQGVASTRMDVRALGDKVQGEPSDRVDLVPNSS